MAYVDIGGWGTCTLRAYSDTQYNAQNAPKHFIVAQNRKTF